MLIRSSVLDLEVFLAGDGAQIELRALAELTGDKKLIKIFREHAADPKNPMKDPHCVEGHLLTGWPVEKIKNDPITRRMTKNTVFGIVYGLGEDNVYPYVVAKIRAVEGPNANLDGISRDRCAETHRNFFRVHTEVQEYHDAMRWDAEHKHYVESLFGFRREIHQGEDETRSTYWGNQAVNSPVQNTAHTFVLICLALLDINPKRYSRLDKCIMEVHDALYFRVKLRWLQEAYAQFIQLFQEDAVRYAEEKCLKGKPKATGGRYGHLDVPILAEAKAGFTMATMVDFEGESPEEFLERWREKAKKIATRSWEDLAA